MTLQASRARSLRFTTALQFCQVIKEKCFLVLSWFDTLVSVRQSRALLQ
jgi:hypothetical protein